MCVRCRLWRLVSPFKPGLEHLTELAKLTKLVLSGTKVTAEGVKSSLLLAAVATLGLSFGWRRGQRTA